MEEHFFPAIVSDQFDALIYLDKTKASACFRVNGAQKR
jgi:hypothetical protein